MKTPEFFNEIPLIVMQDPLSAVLGAAEEGILEYSYVDVVKLAGHSCPTVAGAYLILLRGLKALYGEELPVRGEIRVEMRGKLGDGVVGVMANVASMITGATDVSGFHGLGGNFDRRGLLDYGIEMEGEMALSRVDTRLRVVVSYDPSSIMSDPRMAVIMPLLLSKRATDQEKQEFADLWQERVRKIMLDCGSESRVVKLSFEN